MKPQIAVRRFSFAGVFFRLHNISVESFVLLFMHISKLKFSGNNCNGNEAYVLSAIHLYLLPPAGTALYTFIADVFSSNQTTWSGQQSRCFLIRWTISISASNSYSFSLHHIIRCSQWLCLRSRTSDMLSLVFVRRRSVRWWFLCT